jgi:hypothetical protein
MAYGRICGSTYLFNHLKENIRFHVKWFKNNGGDNLWALENVVKRDAGIASLQALPVATYPILDVFIEDWFESCLFKDYYTILWSTSHLNPRYVFDNLFRIANEKMNLKETASSFIKELVLIEEFIETGKIDRFKLNRGLKKAYDKTNKNPNSKEYKVIKNFLFELELMVENKFELYPLLQVNAILFVDFNVVACKELPVLKFEEFLLYLTNKQKKENFDMWVNAV